MGLRRFLQRAPMMSTRRPRIRQTRRDTAAHIQMEALEDRTLLSTDIWTGAADSNWSNPNNWSMKAVPGTSDTAEFTSGSTSNTADVDASFTIADLVIDSSWGGTINVNNPLTVSDNMTLASGALNVNSAMSIGGAGSQWSGGSISDSGSLTNNGTLTTSNSVTLSGGGSLINAGTIDQAGTGTLEIEVPTTNTGTIEATDGGTLEISGITVTNTGGTISTDSTSNLTLYAATVNGGSLSAASGGTIDGIDRPHLNGVTITQGTTYLVNDYTYLDGNLTNEGTIIVGNGNQLLVNASAVSLSGGGTITLDAGSEIAGNSSSYSLTNVDNTIQGQGTIEDLTSFQNGGTVDALGGTLETYEVLTTNTGTLEATDGGTLTLFDSTVNNAGQPISADSTLTVTLYAEIVNGGSLSAPSGGTIDGVDRPQLINVTITQGTTFSVDDYTYLDSDLVNEGTIIVGSGNQLLVNASTVSLSGGGTITLGAGSEIAGNLGSESLTNVDNTIQGQGTIESLSNFTNQAAGTVNASASGATLETYEVPTTNTGTLEATGGGTLKLFGSTINDAGQTISADSTSHLVLYAEIINGGSLTAASGGTIDGVDRPQLINVTITQGTTFSVDDYTYLDSDLVNEGTIIVGSGNQLLVNASTVSLSGGGTITLGAGSEIAGNLGSESLTNVDNTIQGQGTIESLAPFQNQAIIKANVPGGTLEINDLNVTNTGTLEATGGGTLYINESTVTNSGETISTDSTSKLVLFDSVINGGNLTAASPAVIDAQYVDYLANVTITSGTTYFVDNSTTYLTGNLINQGTIIVGDASDSSDLVADVSSGTLTISGGGTINLNNAGSALDGNSNNETLENQDNTIEGQGQIAYHLASFQNDAKATVSANVPGGTLEINDINVTNTGTIEATGGGELEISASTVTNSGGTISTDSTSKLVLTDSTVNGGNLTAASPAVIDAQYVDYLANVTITSGTTYFVDNSDTYLTGNLINQGTIIVGDASDSSDLVADVQQRHDYHLRRRHHQPQQRRFRARWHFQQRNP